MKKIFHLLTLTFALLLVGCSSNHAKTDNNSSYSSASSKISSSSTSEEKKSKRKNTKKKSYKKLRNKSKKRRQKLARNKLVRKRRLRKLLRKPIRLSNSSKTIRFKKIFLQHKLLSNTLQIQLQKLT